MHCEVRAESTGQRACHPGIIFENNNTLCHKTPVFQPVVNGGRQRRLGLRGGLGIPQLHRHLLFQVAIRNQTTGEQGPFLIAARMLQPEASRSSSAGSRPFLQPAPALSGRRMRAACLLQRVSETSLKGPLPFPVPELFSPVAGGTLQTWPTGFRSVYLL